MFKFTPKFKEAIEKNPDFVFITKIGPSDIFDLSHYGSAIEAAEAEAYVFKVSQTHEQAAAELLNTISEFKAEEVLQAAERGEVWPLVVGYVEFDEIKIKPYTADGSVITTGNAIGVVKSILLDLSPGFYPNGERAYPSIRANAKSFNEQIEAIAGWCIREMKTTTIGGASEKRLKKALSDCIALLSKQPTNRNGVVGFNVSRRAA